MEELEKRMYFFVPYNISPIQQAIQAGHAALEYARIYGSNDLFCDFVENWKTWIILNGGTTNGKIELGNNPRTDDNPYNGSLDNLAHQIIREDIECSTFQEPDLNDALTAVCFICDERVFNYEDYPDFVDWIRAQDFVDEDEKLNSFISLEGLEPDRLKELFPGMYPLWFNRMGGGKNLFLRELLRGKKLA